jgi:hypothetical protein
MFVLVEAGGRSLRPTDERNIGYARVAFLLINYWYRTGSRRRIFVSCTTTHEVHARWMDGIHNIIMYCRLQSVSRIYGRLLRMCRMCVQGIRYAVFALCRHHPSYKYIYYLQNNHNLSLCSTATLLLILSHHHHQPSSSSLCHSVIYYYYYYYYYY